MKTTIYFLLTMCVLLFSCYREAQKGELLEIAVDIDQNFPLPLSDIADEIIAIVPELTDESLVNPDRIQCVLLSEDYVIIAELDKILVFEKDGKFVRAIGSVGQGPGEFIGVRNIALDKNNKYLYVHTSTQKIICYDLITGNYLKESASQIGTIKSIHYVNDELLLLAQRFVNDEKGYYTQLSLLYHSNNELQITDSVLIRKNYFAQTSRTNEFNRNFILSCNSTIYIYSPEIIPNMSSLPVSFLTDLTEVVVRDTLYRFENNHLIPELKLKFKNDGIKVDGNQFINIFSIYRSSRYIFSYYLNTLNNNLYHFCYDTKTGQGYNMQDGYTDDTNNIEKLIDIHPFKFDMETFYYWHTHMNPDDLEEPNPTIYIGTLKK